MSKDYIVESCSQPYDMGCVAHCGKEQLNLIAQKDGVHQFVFQTDCIKQIIEVDGSIDQPFIIDLSLLPVNRELVFHIIDPDGAKYFDDMEIVSCDPCEETEPIIKCYSEFLLQTTITIITSSVEVELIEAGVNLTPCE